MTGERQAFLDAQRRMLERYGVEAESRFVDAPSIGGRAHVLVTGVTDDAPPVVLINGIGTPAAMWAPLMAHLEGFRLFAVDLPGYGLTDAPPRFAHDLRGSAVRFLGDVLDALELPAPPFVANSLGSLFTSWLALDRPGRVSALAHVGCPAMALGTSAPLPMRILSVRPAGRLLTRLQPPSPEQVDGLAKMVNEDPLVPELVDLLVATERLPHFRGVFLSTLHTLLRLRGSRPATRLTAEELARIEHPALLVWGEDDPFGPPEVGERMVDVMPSAELAVVPGGHAPWLAQAERIGPRVTGFVGRSRDQPAGG